MTLFQERYRIESTRVPDWDYSARGWYFVTICTRDRKHSLGNAVAGKIQLSEAGAIAETEMRMVSSRYASVAVDRFVIMPNHVHAIVVVDGVHAYSPSSPEDVRVSATSSPTLSNIVGGYKAGVTRICRVRGIADFAWQLRFHEHILRSNASVNAVRDYIERNPQNWLEDPDNARRGPAV
jgi:putative transposase